MHSLLLSGTYIEMEYYKVYLQKTRADAPTVETIQQWGLYCSAFDFSHLSKAKELPKRVWNDEDGDDLYYPDLLRLSSGTVEVEFSYKGSKGSANAAINSLVDYCSGGDGLGTAFRLYCNYNGLGWGSVHFKEVKDKATLVRDDDGDILVFSVVFSVDDPRLRVAYVDGGWRED